MKGLRMDGNQRLINQILENEQREAARRDRYDNVREIEVNAIGWHRGLKILNNCPEVGKTVFIKRGSQIVIGHRRFSNLYQTIVWVTDDGCIIEDGIDGWYEIAVPKTWGIN